MKKEKSSLKRLKALAIGTSMLATSVVSPFVFTQIESVSAADVEVNFAKAFQYSIYFYDANMCGTEVEENNGYTWRGDCHTYDAELSFDVVYSILICS